MQFDRFLESHLTVLHCDTVCFVAQCGSHFLLCGPCSVTILWKATEQHFHVVLFVFFFCLFFKKELQSCF